MNFSQKKTATRARHLESPAARRLYKCHLIILGLMMAAGIALFCFSVVTVAGTLHDIVRSAPAIDSVFSDTLTHVTSVCDANGNVIGTLSDKDKKNNFVSLEDIPSNLQNAIIATEDEDFFDHHGIDFQSIVTMFKTHIQNRSENESHATLSQQLLLNRMPEFSKKQTLSERLRQSVTKQYLTLCLEQKYTKKQILESYLNTICLGQNTFGVQDASRRYFDRDVSSLTLSECAVLAAIAKNPSACDPVTHPKRNRERRTIVLTNMKTQGYITNEDYTLAMEDDVYSRIQKTDNHSSSSAFTDELIRQVIDDLKNRLGYTETQAYNALYNRGLTIYSTQNVAMQKLCDETINDKTYYPKDSSYRLSYRLSLQKKDGAEQTVNEDDMIRYLKKQGAKSVSSYYKTKAKAKQTINRFKTSYVKKGDRILSETIQLTIEPQASLVLINQKNGAVMALCGGRSDEKNLTRASESYRQPGSLFSILSTYLPALDTAGMTLGTVFDDSPYTYPDSDLEVKNWYGDSYRGLTPIRSAIADSMNIVAVKTLEQIGPRTGYDYLKNLGFSSLTEKSRNASGKISSDITLSSALGELTKGVSTLELTAAFAAIADNGKWHSPVFYTKITDADGKILLENPDGIEKQVMKDSTAWLLTQAMIDSVQTGSCTGLKFRKLSTEQAGAAGTCDKTGDFFAIGFTPSLTAGIWYGDDDADRRFSGGSPSSMWRDILEKLESEDNPQHFLRPSSITSADICTKCGKLAVEGLCSLAVGGSCRKTEYFSMDSVPTESCDCHVKCRICKSSGHLAGDNCPESLIYTAVYLQKNESSPKKEQNSTLLTDTADTPLIIPQYLSNSLCEVHN